MNGRAATIEASPAVCYAPTPVVPEGEDSPPASPALACEEFIARHEAALRRQALHLCRGSFDADEVVQATRILAFRHYGKLRDHSRGLGWLLRILHHAFLDVVRRQQAQRRNQPVEAAESIPLPEDPRPAWDRVTREMLEACVARLPDELRECYRLQALEGRDYNFISAELGIPKSTVGTRILRARKRLKKMLQAELGEEAP